MIHIPAAALMTLLIHAPLPPLGGTVVIYDRDTANISSPLQANTTGTKTLSMSIFEPIFGTDAKGNVIGRLVQDNFSYKNGILTFSLRKNLFLHNGEPLGHKHILKHFNRLAQEGSLAEHIVAPFTATNSERAAPKLNLSYSSESMEFQIVTEPPYPDIARLLSTPRSAVSVGTLGTGPFTLISTEPVVLESFTQFRRGAPYVDRIEHKGNISPFKARAALRSGEADMLFGVNDLDRKTETFAKINESQLFEDFIVLQVGQKSTDLANASDLNNLRSALNRNRLVRRYLSGRATPVTNFFAHNQKLPRARQFERSRRVRTMILDKGSVASIRFAERVQFELVKVGLTVKIETLSKEGFKQRVASRDYDFALRTLSLSQVSENSSASKLHRLLEVASENRIFEQISSAKNMSTFALARREEQSSILAKLEKDLRESARIIVIAKQIPFVIQRKVISSSNDDSFELEYLEKN